MNNARRISYDAALTMIVESAPDLTTLQYRAKNFDNWFRIEVESGSVAKLSDGYYVFWPNEEDS